MQFLGFIIPQRIFPFLISSFLFGIMHFWNPEVEKLGSVIIIAYITMGLFFGAITLLDEGLELAIGFHIGNNLLLALMLTSDWTVFQTYLIMLIKRKKDFQYKKYHYYFFMFDNNNVVYIP